MSPEKSDCARKPKQAVCRFARLIPSFPSRVFQSESFFRLNKSEYKKSNRQGESEFFRARNNRQAIRICKLLRIFATFLSALIENFYQFELLCSKKINVLSVIFFGKIEKSSFTAKTEGVNAKTNFNC